MTQVMPSARTTRQCHRLHGRRSSRAGMLDRNVARSITAAALIASPLPWFWTHLQNQGQKRPPQMTCAIGPERKVPYRLSPEPPSPALGAQRRVEETEARIDRN